MKSNVHRFAGGEPKFSEMLVDIYSTLKPGLAVMDAVWGMDGDGPTYGRTRKIGYVLASKNPAALDATAARMAGFSSMEVHTIRISMERNLFPKNIEIAGGDPVPTIPDFRRPATARTSITNFAQRIFYNLTRLQPESNKNCVGCATCAKGCPVGAIEMVANRPKFDRKKCIYCYYCCHELCPHSAMVLRRAPKLPFYDNF